VECRDENKRTFVMVLVGALNVGKMVLLFEDKIKPIVILERLNTISIKIYGLIRGSYLGGLRWVQQFYSFLKMGYLNQT